MQTKWKCGNRRQKRIRNTVEEPEKAHKRIFKYFVPSTNRRQADDRDPGAKSQEPAARIRDPAYRVQDAESQGSLSAVKGPKLTKHATPPHTHVRPRAPHTSVFTFHSLFPGFYSFSFHFSLLLACETTANGNELFSKVFTASWKNAGEN